MRGWLVVPLAIGFLSGGCDKTHPPLVCSGSLATYCAIASNPCAMTWTEAQSDTWFCQFTTAGSPLEADCGPYHAITLTFVDSSRTYYYDVASGKLVAVITADANRVAVTCDAGPSSGFTPPVCSGAGSQTLPVCVDGGTDAATD
ncbi:MAG TPA: hypothetical protein VKQ32_17740 [Polyangia bacterium]|nr:hypothetical protein [Polyangia bacterium]